MKKIMTFLLCLILTSSYLVSDVQAATFKDIPSTNVYHKEISYLADRGIIKGYSNGTFKPNNHVTNRQAAVMLVRMLKLENEKVPAVQFADVPATDSAIKEISIAVAKGIFPNDKKFYPNNSITRESMARALTNAFQIKGTYEGAFSDVPKSYWAYVYIEKLAANNITTGYDDGSFKPKNPVTRAHFSVFLARAMDPKFKPTQINKPSELSYMPLNKPADFFNYTLYADGMDSIFFTKKNETNTNGVKKIQYILPDPMGESTEPVEIYTYTQSNTEFSFQSAKQPAATATLPFKKGTITKTEGEMTSFVYDNKTGEYIKNTKKVTATNTVKAVNETVKVNTYTYHNVLHIQQEVKDGKEIQKHDYYFKKDAGLFRYSYPGVNIVMD